MDINTYKEKYFTNPKLEDNAYAFLAIRKSILLAVDAFRKQAKGVLVDLGCGVMPYKEYIMDFKRVDKYIGIDLSPTVYHNKVNPDLVWDGNHIPLDNDSIDYLMATEFLEHYYDTSKILTEIKRVLKPGGVFFFTVPFLWPIHEKPYDYHRFTPFTLEIKFQEAGYSSWDIQSLGGINYCLATMGGLWLDHSGISGWKKRLIKTLYKPLYERLLNKDIKPKSFNNYEMHTGLYGFVTK